METSDRSSEDEAEGTSAGAGTVVLLLLPLVTAPWWAYVAAEDSVEGIDGKGKARVDLELEAVGIDSNRSLSQRNLV
jgi:hypothetical protein